MEKLIRTLNFEIQAETFEIEIFKRKKFLKSEYEAVLPYHFDPSKKKKSLGIYKSESDCLASIPEQLNELLKEPRKTIFKIVNTIDNRIYAIQVKSNHPLAFRISKLFKKRTGNIFIENGAIKEITIGGETKEEREKELYEEYRKWGIEIGTIKEVLEFDDIKKGTN